MLDPLCAWLRDQRLARGWSVAEMGRQLTRAAKATGDHTVPRTAILASYVRRWESGKIGLTERYQLHYATALGFPPAQFGPQQPQARQVINPSADTAFCHMATASPLTTPDVQPRSADGWPGDPCGYRERRTRNDAGELARPWTATLPLCQLVVLSAEESLDFGEWADTSNIGDATLEHYATQVRQHARDYVHAPPYPLLLDVKRLRDRVFAKLQGHQRPGQTRDLYLMGSQVCGMPGFSSALAVFGGTRVAIGLRC